MGSLSRISMKSSFDAFDASHDVIGILNSSNHLRDSVFLYVFGIWMDQDNFSHKSPLVLCKRTWDVLN